MNHKYKILFDAYHLYHLPQFDPVIDLLAQDDRFELFLSTSSEIDKGERELALSIMEKRPGTIIKAYTEQERSDIIRNLAPDVFICGWSRYKIEKFIPPKKGKWHVLRVIREMIYHRTKDQQTDILEDLRGNGNDGIIHGATWIENGNGGGGSTTFCDAAVPDGWVANNNDDNDSCTDDLIIDCLGICDGTAVVDECGICEG